MAGNAALAFGALVAGVVLIDYGVKSAKPAFASSVSAPGGSTPGTNVAGFPSGAVDPVPGASASRLDQGLDVTTKTWAAPFSGTVAYVNNKDAGWKGGGYVAVQSDENPNFVYYAAEGITAIVQKGEHVTAGQTLGYPIANPYNGIVGNGEIGRANPANPAQPLAQVVSDASSMVDDFYNWILAIGGPKAVSTSGAGHA